MHEFGHALVARRHGVKVEEIDLWLLGGVARMSGRPRSAGDELRYKLQDLLQRAWLFEQCPVRGSATDPGERLITLGT